MKRLLMLLLLTFSPMSLAATKDCAQCLTKKQLIQRDKDRARIKKEREDLRAEIARLKAENKELREHLAEKRSGPATGTFRVAQETPSYREPKKNRITALIGEGPDSLGNKRREDLDGNVIGIRRGLALGAQYSRLFGDTFSATIHASTPTRPKSKEVTVMGGVGIDF